MNKPCKYCGCIKRDDLTPDAYSSAVWVYCPVMDARIDINGMCTDNAKRLAYTGKMHFIDIDMEGGKNG